MSKLIENAKRDNAELMAAIKRLKKLLEGSLTPIEKGEIAGTICDLKQKLDYPIEEEGQA